jgi:hypothetical protein
VTFGDPALWSTTEWRATATAWIDERLAAAGARRTGPIEQPRVRRWATLLRVPTTRGTVWFKAGGAQTGYEAGLHAVLAELVPDRILEPFAVDADRGWILLPDAGPSLGERLGDAQRRDAMTVVLQRYGELQRRVAPAVERLIALGVPDMRAHVMPARFEQALTATRGMDPDGGLHARLAAMSEQVDAWCRLLAAAPVAPSIDHNDLHDRNVIGEPGAPRFYDWGDSVVAHPFASMLLPLTMSAGDDRLRDAYLEAWSDVAPRAELVETLELACRVAKIARSLTWLRAIGDGTDEDWATAPLHSLASLLEDSYLGGA